MIATRSCAVPACAGRRRWPCTALPVQIAASVQTRQSVCGARLLGGPCNIRTATWPMRCNKSFMCRGRDLISKLLVVKPNRRLTASEALGHAWFAQQPRPDDAVPLDRALSNLCALDQRFRVVVTSVVAASRISATLSRITDGMRTTGSMDSGRQVLRTTGSVLPLTATSDAVDATDGTRQMWDKEVVSEGVWGRTEGVLDTVVEDEHYDTGGNSHAGALDS